jgi:hypothetical protein
MLDMHHEPIGVDTTRQSVCLKRAAPLSMVESAVCDSGSHKSIAAVAFDVDPQDERSRRLRLALCCPTSSRRSASVKGGPGQRGRFSSTESVVVDMDGCESPDRPN